MSNDKELMIRIRADIRQSLAELKKVSAEINKTGETSAKSSKQVKEMGGALGALKPLFATVFTAASARALVTTLVEYERLAAVMKTLTGDSRTAAVELDKLKQFATETPFELQKVVQAFARLQSVGLDPSTEALRSYGNTAAAMGKDLIQFVEAVADATTGEFERLKDFGIKAASEGDKVRFTFRGTTTEVRKDAREIETYLRSIGDTEFASGMADQMKTLGGVFSNLRDELFNLSAEIGKAGLSDFLKDVARDAIDAVKWVLKFNNALDFLDERLGLSRIAPEKLSDDGLGARLELLKDQIAELEGKKGDNASVTGGNRGRLITRNRKIEDQLQELRLRQAELEQERNERANAPQLVQPGSGTPDPSAEDKAAQKAAERAAKQREDSVRSLELEARTYSMTAAQVALYRLELDGASQAELARAGAALDSIATNEAFEATVRAAAEALEDLKSEGKEVYESTRTDLERLADTMERYRFLLQEGAIDQETFNRAVAGAKEDFKKIKKAGDESFKALEDAVQGWGREFTDIFTEMVTTGKLQFKDLANSIIRDLIRIQVQERITNPLLEAGTAFLSKHLPSATAAAAGGYISGPGTATSDSIPARLSNGEYVVRAAAVKAYGAEFLEAVNQMRLPRYANVPRLNISRPRAHFAEGGLVEPLGTNKGDIRVEVINKGQPMQAQQAGVSFDARGMIISIITDDLQRGGPIGGALSRVFNLRRGG